MNSSEIDNHKDVVQETRTRRQIYGIIEECNRSSQHEDVLHTILDIEELSSNYIDERYSFRKGLIGIAVASLCVGVGIGGSASFLRPFGEAYYHQKYATKLGKQDHIVTSESIITNGLNEVIPYDNGILPPELDGSIVSIAKSIGPCVVSIYNNKKVSLNDRSMYYTDSATEGMITGLGSGVIFDQDKENYYIITNYHVIEGADSLAVNFVGDIKSEAKLVGKDATTDIAVVRVEKIKLSNETMEALGIAPLGDSDRLEVGQLAVAIGTPATQALSNTVTTGIISGVGRDITLSGNKMKVIQTSAAINSGNSGGALVSSTGEVIGINVAKTVNTEGIGFAIPINQVKLIVTELMENGSVERPALGITGIEVTDSKATQYGLPIGIYIESVLTGGSADLAGIKSGDILIQFEGTTIMTINQLKELIAKKHLGDIVEVRLIRGEETKTFKLELKTMPD